MKDCDTRIVSDRIKAGFSRIGGDVKCVDSPHDRSLLTDVTDFTYIESTLRNLNSRLDVLCVSENMYVIESTIAAGQKPHPCSPSSSSPSCSSFMPRV